ncbi:MAG: PKD domain-containing protein [Bacteroidetes bacterium]|nr:MAG: PKD domain-containing protein [Bacteroidota bacterium]
MARFIHYFLTTAFALLSGIAQAQTCVAAGQNPSTAFPVCGTSVFSQRTVPLCGGRTVPNPTGCSPILDDRNPFWYKFTCFRSGTLGFTIAPNSSSSDYDWQIWDITNRNPSDVYNNVSWVISCNWSGETGNTGASAAGSAQFVCEGVGRPLFSSMPNLVQGNTYLMLISHFSATQAGYSLSFSGGTASITDSTPPRLDTALASCSGDRVSIKLNKKMRCSSLAANGSDFSVPGATVASAVGVGCSSGFDTDSIVLTLAAPLIPGQFEVAARAGTDGNTLLDYCDNALPPDDRKRFTVFTNDPTLLDSIAPVACQPRMLTLVMNKAIACSTIAADGSDFSLVGPNAPAIEAAAGSCNADGLSRVITLRLSRPISIAGLYTVFTKVGTDGNTIVNQCNRLTPAGSFKSFVAYDSAKATIGQSLGTNCKINTFSFTSVTNHSLTSWLWTLPTGQSFPGPTFTRSFAYTDTVVVQLKVSNGICTDSTVLRIPPGIVLGLAKFTMPPLACPLDTVFLADSSSGPIVSRRWSLGNAPSIGNLAATPTLLFANAPQNNRYPITLAVTDSFGCTDSITKTIFIPGNCYIAVATAFTPNGDGLNDFLYPINAYKAQNLEFSVYNRYGQRVWYTTNWQQKWNGSIRGQPQGAGVYVWKLNYFDPDLRRTFRLSGTSTLIR